MSARRQTRRRPRAVSLRQEARPKPAQRGSSRRPTDCIARATSEALEGPARQSLSREQISGPAKKHGDRLAPIWSAHFQPRPDGATAWSTGLKTRGGAALAKLEQLLRIEVMSLAAASRDLGRRCVCRYQASRKLDASVDEPVCAPAKFGAGPNLRNIVLHVLGRPATTVGDKWKLRKREAKLSKEHQHLAR